MKSWSAPAELYFIGVRPGDSDPEIPYETLDVELVVGFRDIEFRSSGVGHLLSVPILAKRGYGYLANIGPNPLLFHFQLCSGREDTLRAVQECWDEIRRGGKSVAFNSNQTWLRDAVKEWDRGASVASKDFLSQCEQILAGKTETETLTHPTLGTLTFERLKPDIDHDA